MKKVIYIAETNWSLDFDHALSTGVKLEKPRSWVKPITRAWYLRPYNPLWPIFAQNKIQQIKSLLPGWLIVDVEHIGSTAIPGIMARPLISINFAVTSVKEAKEAIQPLLDKGWEVFIDTIDVLCLIKREESEDDLRGYQIYFITKLQRQWYMKRAFRNYLIAHPQEADEYEQLKIKNADLYRDDVEKYRLSKSEFVLSILQKCGFKGLYLGNGIEDEGGVRGFIPPRLLSFYGMSFKNYKSINVSCEKIQGF